MQKIINETKLDFDDVLIVPQRSTLTSRSEINLERTFYFYHSPRKWTGVPIVCANMSFCSFDMAKALAKHKMVACLHKYHSVDDLANYFNENPNNIDYTFVSIGYKKGDLNHLLQLKEKLGKQPNICIDVPNGHMDVFVKYCKKVRDNFPESIIIAGNVTNTSSTQELIIYGGVDIVKCGIGGGCFIAGTKILTPNGTINIEQIKRGDIVLSGNLEPRKVLGVSQRIEHDTLISVNGILCTPNHPFYVAHKDDLVKADWHKYAKYIAAADLNKDHVLFKIVNHGSPNIKLDTQQIYELSSEEVENVVVYDIEVDIDHSFAVNGGVIVHNSACTTRFLTGCFAAGTRINTELGYKNIENIEIGDKVLTHDGSYEKVIKTHNNGKRDKLIEINGITCTEDHLFYVIEKNIANLINDNNINEYAYWLEAGKISENKHYIIEIIQ